MVADDGRRGFSTAHGLLFSFSVVSRSKMNYVSSQYRKMSNTFLLVLLTYKFQFINTHGILVGHTQNYMFSTHTQRKDMKDLNRQMSTWAAADNS